MNITKLSIGILATLIVAGLATWIVKDIQKADAARADITASMAECITLGNPLGDCAGRIVIHKGVNLVVYDVFTDKTGGVVFVTVRDPEEDDKLQTFFPHEVAPGK